MRFVDTDVALTSDSPELDEECDRLDESSAGRGARPRPGTAPTRNGESVTLPAWGEQIFAEMAEVARSADAVEEGEPHAAALKPHHAKDPSLTPSAQMLARCKRADHHDTPRSMAGRSR